MLSRIARVTAAVLSGVTASLLVGATTTQAAQDKPLVVYAEPQEDLRTERVSFRDLDLAVKADQKALFRRVAGAVNRVCTLDGSSLPTIDGQYFACRADSMAYARPQIARAIAHAEQLALSGQPSITVGAISISARAE